MFGRTPFDDDNNNDNNNDVNLFFSQNFHQFLFIIIKNILKSYFPLQQNSSHTSPTQSI